MTNPTPAFGPPSVSTSSSAALPTSAAMPPLFSLPPFLIPIDWPGLPPGIGVASTCRKGGVSLPPYDDGSGAGGFNLGSHVGDDRDHVQRNRAQLEAYLPAPVRWLSQVHGTCVLELGLTSEPASGLTPGPDRDAQAVLPVSAPQADACLTRQVGVVCGIMTADCLPVLLCDPKAGIVAAAHAGWRGLVDGVLENTVARMVQSGANPEHMMCWMGPAIGPAQFEVGAEVRARFVDLDQGAEAAFTAISGSGNSNAPGRVNDATEKFYADLYQLARRRLLGVGIHQVAGGGRCTVSEPESFYSYRRDGVTGRMASMIWLK